LGVNPLGEPVGEAAMSREWFDEFLNFLKTPLNSDLSPLALAQIAEIQTKRESAFEDDEYSDL
jgi:hypothetical protein